MSCGFTLWAHLVSVMDKQTDLHDSCIFELPHPFQDAHELVRMDYAVYLKDLERSKQMQFSIPLKNSKGSGEVDALLIENPKSLLFRSWERGDNQHSPKGKGFPMLVVNYNHERYVISVDPQSPYHLKGIGELLEVAEIKKRELLGRKRQGELRPGYSSPDPWYDGRNSLHNFTIIDTPRGGTVLTQHEIQMIIEQYSRMNIENL